MSSTATTELDVAFILTNASDATTCVVQMKSGDGQARYSGIGRDDVGAFLVTEAGDKHRLGDEVPEEFDSMLEHPVLRLSLVDADGAFVEEYDIAAVAPEVSAGFGR